MAACQHCSATESACQWRDGCCEYCNHIEGRDLNATDPAVTAAAEAIDGPGSTYLIQRGHVDIDDVARVVAAARPIIEAEVIARLAAKWQSLADHDPLCGMGTEAQHLHGCGTPVCVCLPVAEVRERIAAEIEAMRDMYAEGSFPWSYLDDAARIARGQS